jgi:hypothetical protein
MTNAPQTTEWTAPVLKQGAVADATSFGIFPVPIDGGFLS